MKGEIEWTQRALNNLAQIWQDASDRRAVNETVDQIEATIRRDPSGAGESRSGNVRIIYALPVGFLYHVDPETDTAVIMTMWIVGPGRRKKT